MKLLGQPVRVLTPEFRLCMTRVRAVTARATPRARSRVPCPKLFLRKSCHLKGGSPVGRAPAPAPARAACAAGLATGARIAVVHFISHLSKHSYNYFLVSGAGAAHGSAASGQIRWSGRRRRACRTRVWSRRIRRRACGRRRQTRARWCACRRREGAAARGRPWPGRRRGKATRRAGRARL